MTGFSVDYTDGRRRGDRMMAVFVVVDIIKVVAPSSTDAGAFSATHAARCRTLSGTVPWFPSGV
jgi:hypothetical protein